MNSLAAQVLADRVVRDAAKSRFDEHYDAFKTDMAERGLGGRIADEAMEQAKLVFDEAVAVVEEHPGAISGTLAALALWFLRNPLIAWIKETFDPGAK